MRIKKMATEMTPQILLIDDDASNNLISKLILKKVIPEAQIISYTDPEAGVKYLRAELTENLQPVTLMLDINMPVLNGWDVLELTKDFPEEIKKLLTVYIVSSSVDPVDKEKAALSPLVKFYIEKPFSIPFLQTIFNKIPAIN